MEGGRQEGEGLSPQSGHDSGRGSTISEFNPPVRQCCQITFSAASDIQ